MRTFILAVSVTAAQAYTQSLADCKAFADKWTGITGSCANDTAFPDGASNWGSAATITCAADATQGTNRCPNTGTASASCGVDRKLCVSCRDDGGTVKIRYQSNGMPTICYQTTNIPNYPTDQKIDFEVTWNADMTGVMNYAAADVDDYEETHDLLCSITRTADSHMHSSAQFDKIGQTSTDTMAGFAFDNISIFNGLALADKGAVETEGDTMDMCLTHSSP